MTRGVIVLVADLVALIGGGGIVLLHRGGQDEKNFHHLWRCQLGSWWCSENLCTRLSAHALALTIGSVLIAMGNSIKIKLGHFSGLSNI